MSCSSFRLAKPCENVRPNDSGCTDVSKAVAADAANKGSTCDRFRHLHACLAGERTLSFQPAGYAASSRRSSCTRSRLSISSASLAFS